MAEKDQGVMEVSDNLVERLRECRREVMFLQVGKVKGCG